MSYLFRFLFTFRLYLYCFLFEFSRVSEIGSKMVTLDIELFAISYCDTFGFFAICLLCIVRIRHRTAKLFVGSKHYINFFFQNRTIANIAIAIIRTDRTHFRISSLQDHESTLFFLRSNIFSRSSLHSTNSSLAATTPCVFTGQSDPPRIPLFALLGAEFPQKLLGSRPFPEDVLLVEFFHGLAFVHGQGPLA